ncbi:HDOD domain-containing protein [Alteromonas halophila]|nr:HDOD domain-containing protein [Alteromonas halophila]
MTSPGTEIVAPPLSISLLTSLFSLIDKPIEKLREEVFPLAKRALPKDIDDSVLIELPEFDACFSYLKKHYLASELATHIPKQLHVSQYGLIGFLIATASDVKHMFQLIEECGEDLGYFHRARVKRHDNNGLRLTLSQQKSWQNLSRDTQSYLVSSWCRLIEVGLGRHGHNKQLQLAVPEHCVQTIQAEYPDVFYVQRSHASSVEIIAPKDFVHYRLPGGNERLHKVFLRELSEIQTERNSQDSLSGKILKYLKSIADYRDVSSTSMASHFAISERTLNRKLASEQTSFKQLFVTVRSFKALTLLLKGESVELVADKMGFSDRTSFERSFKSWQGVTPAKFQGKYAALCSEKPAQDILDPQNIPSLPDVATKLLSELNKPEANMNAVADIVTHDAMLSAKVLWVANSSYYGNLEIKSVKHAILSVFGTSKLKALVISLCAENLFQIPEDTFNYDEYHFCSYLTARAVELLYDKSGTDKKLVADLYFAGLLHNIGHIFIRYCLPEKYAEIYAETRKEASWETVNNVQSLRLNINASECSAMLAMAWELPFDIKGVLKELAYPTRQSEHVDVLRALIELMHQTYRAKGDQETIDAIFASTHAFISSVGANGLSVTAMSQIRAMVDEHSYFG